MRNHEYFMNLAIREALKARGMTSPNPLVGALVVKNNHVIAKGFHKKAGFAHAEVVALDAAGKKAEGAILYVTLEPCTHFGRTPPCVERIIRSGVKEVIVGMLDPNPVNNGKGIQILRKHNIKVEVGFLEEELKKINEVFLKYTNKKVPFVTVKVAQSLDGKIASKTGDSKWITSDKSRVYSHKMRKNYDAIMIGVNTVLRDNPKLASWFSQKNPTKIIVDSQLSTPVDANIFMDDSKVIIVTVHARPGQETENRKALAQKANILEVKERAGQVSLKDMMKKLAQLDITNILAEGGGTLIGSLFDEGLVDRIMFFISPKIIGGKDAVSSVMGHGITRIDKAVKLKDVSVRYIGEDLLVEAHV